MKLTMIVVIKRSLKIILCCNNEFTKRRDKMDALIDDKYRKEQSYINGYKMFSKNYINGSPTVLFEAGMGDGSETWNDIQNKISLLTSTFSYDRVGTGKSDAALMSRTCLEIVQDLSKLLAKVSVKPPFILVGHSFGGLVSRLFASIYPNLIAGMILVDAAPEYKEIAYEKVLPSQLITLNREYYNNPMLNVEKIDKVKSYKQIDTYKCVFDFPLTVIIRGLQENYDKDWPNQDIFEVEQKLQVDFKNLSTKSKIIIAKHSGHYIQNDEPELIVEAIVEMINKYRS
jgi:pimeloyl-ACP methyl ester carboxylesterase